MLIYTATYMRIHELGHVVLYVTDVERMGNFYRDTLGFQEIDRQGGFAVFSSGRTHHELLLIQVGGTKKPKDHFSPGLYHIGFKVGDTTDELRAVYHELKERGVTILGTADHAVTHSLYIEDPDGNELELYVDVSDEWKQNPEAIMTPTRPLILD
jgi:catechol 2,3-dioxygenase